MARLKSLPWQGAARRALDQLLARQVHAVLLHGPAGIGKLDLALDAVDDLLCEQRRDGGSSLASGAGAGGEGAACGQCAGCALMAAGNHPDLAVVRPAALAELDGRGASAPEDAEAGQAAATADAKTRASREIRIEQIRDLLDWITLTTHRGGRRIIVIEPAESMNVPSSNALLKMLEEPPPHTLFLLVSHQIDRVLPTLRSRCALLRVGLPAATAATAWLQSQGIDQPQQKLLEAGGAPLIAAQAERGGLGAELRDQLLGLLRQGARLSAAAVVAGVPRDVPVGGSVALFQRWGWDFLAFSLAGEVRYHPGELAALRQLAGKWQPAEACAWVADLAVVRALSEHPLNAKLTVEGMLLSYLRSINGS